MSASPTVSAPRRRLPVAVLGATGAVGQAFVRRLAGHPWLELVAVAASEQSAGRRYGDAVRWREPVPLPDAVADLVVGPCAPPLDASIVFSALDADVALEVEPAFARAGALVVTNASAFRMEPDVPLLIAEVNSDHLALLEGQRKGRGWRGGIIANPNCSTAALVLALVPLHRAFTIEKLFVSTMQAVSGAGYPGVASLDILGNVIPYIANEEEKVERETRKLLGALDGRAVEEARIALSVHTNRVGVEDGHTENVSVGFAERVTPDEAIRTLEAFRPCGLVATLPSTPERPVEVDRRPDRPQPARDRDRGNGMTVTVGRVRPCPVLDLRLTLMGHNRIRGAAGGAVQLGELLAAEGVAR
ncbi:MAG TPA: aspartate-semialdehyde dehydrogenase [Gemmatimonadales bacterium]|jgi:aspartate-semialdehyde dehydrogenase|nr:aspartate-semialdehyde dehydrogenase [Gemmatimonadales bacterium]